MSLIKNNNIKYSTIVPAFIRQIWQRGWDPRNSFYNAFIITCPLPYKWEIYNFVTISTKKCCSASNLKFIEISKTPPSLNIKKINSTEIASSKIAVCVKGMDFLNEKELSIQKMAEWIELQLELGADAIVIYLYYIPNKILNLLKNYQNNGKIKIVNFF